MINRRGFLSTLVAATTAAFVPKKSYFFLNGLWYEKWELFSVDGATVFPVAHREGADIVWKFSSFEYNKAQKAWREIAPIQTAEIEPLYNHFS